MGIEPTIPRLSDAGLTTWRLLPADDPKIIAEADVEYGMTQDETVATFESRYWTSSVPEFVSGKGTPGERPVALLAAYLRHKSLET